jgi:hypothetical protein
MFLRVPIEYSVDSNFLAADNPLRLVDLLPKVRDSVKRMEIMGVVTRITADNREVSDSQALPFLKIYHHWRTAMSTQDEGKILNDSLFDFHETLVVQDAPSLSRDTQTTGDSVHLDEFSENELHITTGSEQASMLFVNDLYYPAWKAWVDGKPTNIVRAFGALRAVPIEAGKHKIVMRYESEMFEVGWKITVVTLILSLSALCLIRPSKKDRS